VTSLAELKDKRLRVSNAIDAKVLEALDAVPK